MPDKHANTFDLAHDPAPDTHRVHPQRGTRSVLFDPVILHNTDTAGCEHLPCLMWLIANTAPPTLTLVGASRTVRDTLAFFLHIRALPTQLVVHETLCLPQLQTPGLHYLAQSAWQAWPVNPQDGNTLPAAAPGSVILLEGAPTPTPHAAQAEPTEAQEWQNLAYPQQVLCCRFAQGNGLGVLAARPVPDCLAPFFMPDGPCNAHDIIRLRQRMDFAGQAWLDKVQLARATRQNHALQAELETLRADSLALQVRTSQQGLELSALHADAAASRARAQADYEHNQALARRMADASARFEPIRRGVSSVPGLVRLLARTMLKGPFPLPDLPSPSAVALPPLPAGKPGMPGTTVEPARGQATPTALHVLFVAGEPDTPGMQYRCVRNAAACQRAGYPAAWKDCAGVTPGDIAWADVVVLWRVGYSGHVSIMLQLARQKGARIIFDTDDLTFIPHLARIDLIDGIRSAGTTEERIETVFTDMQRTLMQADMGFAPTDTLADAMRVYRPVTHTVPNTYDAAFLAQARLACRAKKAAPSDGLVRIGYATGSRTHQKDFACACAALVAILREKPQVRLVLFREAETRRPVLLTDEFPALEPVAAQIEWRDMVPLADLAQELARFDICIAPLEVQSAFCNAKSEIKFFESALAGVPCIASPTAPFRQCVVHGRTGLLADTQPEWEDALRLLVDKPELRARMARDAHHAVLWQFGPQRQTRLFRTLLASLGGEDAAARAAETLIARTREHAQSLPDIPDCTVLFEQDRLENAVISVVITNYNYAHLVLEALESVRAQTLQLLDLIVVDDGSTDESPPLIQAWMTRHSARFNRLLLLRTRQNAGLGAARNCGVAHTETPFFLPLDADNRLLPSACARLLAAMDDMTAYAYPVMAQFGAPGHTQTMGEDPFEPMRFMAGNYIDALALVAKWAWAAAGGYYTNPAAMGWEDYDLWCSLAELGLRGTHVPTILAEYRVHPHSMTNSVTETTAHKERVVALLEHRHPWLRLVQKAAKERV
ncbi:glycosyltransferase [Acetobacter sp. TBRC 12305]|uniref:Glycosyltransferase n=1 Tax=Acetobacter garciniae TaxID=2817435 RepID=A0A939HMJ7_9PROT|nr:glycosyltransferase [Acetobacter garciniae]MBO1324404.1 glycosyltransferase [Acetobacter garciniae]MBX0344093.1 glycosyltransferase [Acetobacter garciniae]